MKPDSFSSNLGNEGIMEKLIRKHNSECNVIIKEFDMSCSKSANYVLEVRGTFDEFCFESIFSKQFSNGDRWKNGFWLLSKYTYISPFVVINELYKLFKEEL